MSKGEVFVLTAEHIALLRHGNVWWCDRETGAPGLDPKRPYGNGNVAKDIADILGWELMVCPECGPVLTDEQRERSATIHHQTETALQLLLLGHTEPGTYEQSREYDRLSWVLVPESEGR